MFRRWFIRVCFLLPLALCVAGWAWSAAHLGYILYARHDHVVYCGTYWGVVSVSDGQRLGYPDGWVFAVDAQPAVRLLPVPDPRMYSFLGCGYWHGAGAWGHNWQVDIPYWLLLLAFGVVLVLVWRKTRPKKPAGAFPVIMSPR